MKNYFDLKGQVAIVTGCSTGLGVQMAKALANQGAAIVAVARRQDMIDAVAEEIAREYEVPTLAIRCDITDTAAVDSMVDQVLEKFGGELGVLRNYLGIEEVLHTHRLLTLGEDEQLSKHDPLVLALKEWVDKQYEDGRTTALGAEELEARIRELAGDRFPAK